MFDIGVGELLLLAVVGLIVFGPEKLPKAAADAARWARQIREMASSARKDIVDSAGIDLSDTMGSLKDLRELHPKRLASGIFEDQPISESPSSNGESGASKPAKSTHTFDPDLS